MQAAIPYKKHRKVELVPKPEWWDGNIPPERIVRVDWNNQHNEWWNETCADVLSVFGLPGHRFYYRPYPRHMTFTFKTIQDADLCRILLSEKL